MSEKFDFEEWKEFCHLREQYFDSKEGFFEVIKNPRFKKFNKKFLGLDTNKCLISLVENLKKENERLKREIDKLRFTIISKGIDGIFCSICGNYNDPR